jgi:hypothetical protein
MNEEERTTEEAVDGLCEAVMVELWIWIKLTTE